MTSSPAPVYSVEHLATFSTSSPQQQQTTPRMALHRLFAMEKTSGIWTQRMAIQLKANHMWILDGESNDVVERFPVQLIQQPIAFSDQNHIYNNILIFTVQMPNESQGELHIFQCVSHNALNIVEDIQQWMANYGVNHETGRMAGEPSIQPNVNVKETVSVFNQIAAQREKKGSSPTGGTPIGHISQNRINANHDPDSRSITTNSSIDSNHHNGAHRTNSQDQAQSNERYVSILNHCFDDIERFIIRLQHAAAALRELQLRNHRRQGKGAAQGDGLLAIRARGPTEEEFFEILSKFKLAFNLLAKLKGCIHDPNAPELVHFLFTPLAIIIEAARSNEPPIDPSIVGVPYLNHEAIDLLANCCTSKEFDLWQSLGPNWVQPIKHTTTRLNGTYQPVFTDGWAPSITEPELIGITSESEAEDDSIHIHREEILRNRRDVNSREYQRGPQFDDSDIDDNHIEGRHIQHRISPSTSSHATRVVRGNSPPSPIDSIERDSPTVQVNELDQSEWLAELQTRNAKIVRVLFPRTANNDKELTVVRGEILEILDDSRKWWRARNWRGQEAHVPHTIVSEIGGHTNGREPHMHGSASPNDDWIRRERQGKVNGKPVPNDISAEIRKKRLSSEEDSLYSVPHKPISSPNQTKRSHQTELELSEEIKPIKSQVKTKQELNRQLNESFKNISLNKEKTDHSIKKKNNFEEDTDTVSVQSQLSVISFHDELNATLKSRKSVNKNSVINSDLNVADTQPNTENNEKNKELTFALLIEHLHRKDFHPRLVSKLIEASKATKDPVHYYLTATKQQLRDVLPTDVADEYQIQRLHSNLLILKNLHSYAPMNDELNNKLKERRTLYDPIKD